MQACSVQHGVAVLAGERSGLVVQVGTRLQTVWLAPPPRGVRGPLRRGLWLHRQALAWSAALRSGQSAPSASQRSVAAVAVASEWIAVVGLGVVCWTLQPQLGAQPWHIPLVIALLRLGLGHGSQQRRDWHRLEHLALDRVRPSTCGRAAMMAATCSAAIVGWIAALLGVAPWLMALADVATMMLISGLWPRFARPVASCPSLRRAPEAATSIAPAWSREAAVCQLLDQLNVAIAAGTAASASSSIGAGVARDLSAVYTVAPEGRGTTSST